MNNDYSESSFVCGTCFTMCPVEEMIMRQKENLVHGLECKCNEYGTRTIFADKNKMVKRFSRLAAGHNNKTSLIRPYPVLSKTVHYLLGQVCMLKNVEFFEIYDFVNDRLQAVKQDAVVQGMQYSSIITLYIPIVRFFIYAHYRLCVCGFDDYDPYLNMKQIIDTIKVVLTNYCDIDAKDFYIKQHTRSPKTEDCNFTYEKGAFSFPKESLGHLGYVESKFSEMNLSDNKESSDNIAEISISELSTYEERNLVEETNQEQNESEDSSDSDSLYSDFQNNEPANDETNERISVREEMECLYLLISLGSEVAILRCLSLPDNIRQALGVMSVGYSCKNNLYSLEDIKINLLLEDTKDAENLCTHYGLSITNNCVYFDKNEFQWNAPLVKGTPIQWIDEKLNTISLDHLLLNGDF